MVAVGSDVKKLPLKKKKLPLQKKDIAFGATLKIGNSKYALCNLCGLWGQLTSTTRPTNGRCCWFGRQEIATAKKGHSLRRNLEIWPFKICIIGPGAWGQLTSTPQQQQQGPPSAMVAVVGFLGLQRNCHCKKNYIASGATLKIGHSRYALGKREDMHWETTRPTNGRCGWLPWTSKKLPLQNK